MKAASRLNRVPLNGCCDLGVNVVFDARNKNVWASASEAGSFPLFMTG